MNSGNTRRMRIVIAEDQGMLRDAMGALLALEEDMEVVGKADNGEKALELIRTLQPDICVLDIEMPLLSGLDVAERLAALESSCRVVIVTTFARAGYFQRSMKAGVRGYLLKDTPLAELTAALRAIYGGGKSISPELAMTMWENANPLTDREREIMQHVAQGLSVADISRTLFLSQGTVRNYISEIMQKLDAKNRIDAVSIARSKGWL